MGSGLLLPGPIFSLPECHRFDVNQFFLMTYARLPWNVDTLGSTVLDLVYVYVSRLSNGTYASFLELVTILAVFCYNAYVIDNKENK